jgi:hypothetical protein
VRPSVSVVGDRAVAGFRGNEDGYSCDESTPGPRVPRLTDREKNSRLAAVFPTLMVACSLAACVYNLWNTLRLSGLPTNTPAVEETLRTSQFYSLWGALLCAFALVMILICAWHGPRKRRARPSSFVEYREHPEGKGAGKP